MFLVYKSNVYNMKKWLIFFLITAIIISFVLVWLQSYNITTNADWEQEIINKSKTNEIDLNSFIGLYNTWSFEKIEIKDSTELNWYKFISTWSDKSFLLIRDSLPIKNYEIYKTFKPSDTSLNELWFSLTWETAIEVKYTESSLLWKIFFETFLPILLLIVFLVIMFKMFWPKSSWWFPFWAQAWKLRTKADVKTNFNDVAWMDEAKWELTEIVDYLKSPEKYKKAWARVPKWVLLYWPPWSWKTLLARAVAWEAWTTFFSASWSEFMEMLVWMWAAKVRELFNKAKTASPAIIFIDEIDTIGKKRGQWYAWSHQEQEQTLNQILTEMDWFEKDTNVIVIAATNRPDTLDPALMRAWRFDRKVYVWRPALEERLMILKLHAEWKKLSKSTDLDSLARRTSWFVWADLENLMNEAALKTAKENRRMITNDDLEYALEKIVMWAEKKIKSIKEKERSIITYHELWHAVTAYSLPNTDPVEKISIVSRWVALWVTWMMPQEDRYLYSKAKFLDELVSLLWWRAAEEVFFWKDEITTWASNDFEKVTRIARDMVTKYWMDDELWTIAYYDRESSEFEPYKPISEDTAKLIDHKVKDIVSTAYKKSIEIIQKNRKTMEKLSKVLLEKEYLSKEEFENIMKDPSICDKILKEFNEKKEKLEEQIIEDNSDENEIEENASLEGSSENDNEKTLNSNRKNSLSDLLDRFLPKRK